MQVHRSARWLLLIALLVLIPASSYAGVFISVGFAPPVLPVYVQPPCPEPGLMWTPGYWAYGDDGYYWVPGAWVPAPYFGALWTPPYWGWSEGVYMFHPGYWGAHVGFYGGVNYGFGYMGVGFVGGEWRGHEFAYNTAVMHVNTTVIRNTYVNETIVHNTTIINNTHVSYNGGPGGISHQASAQERVAMNEQHMQPTSVQQQHIQAARVDKASYFTANNGHPQNVAMARPMTTTGHPAVNAGVHGNANANLSHPTPQARPAYQQPQGHPGSQPQTHAGPAPQYHPAPQPQVHPAPQPQYHPAPQPQSHPAPQARPEPQSRPESHPEPHAREPKR